MCAVTCPILQETQELPHIISKKAEKMTDQTSRLLAGVGRTDITPPGDCFLEGFAGRDHYCEGVHDPLEATALALEAYGRRTVIVALDLLDLSDSLIDEIWTGAKTRFGLAPRDLLINCSHTHAGPILWPRIHQAEIPDPKKVFPDRDYLRRLVDNILSAVGTALGNLTPARASRGFGETRIGICRRAKDVSVYKEKASGYLGIFANYPNPDREVDRTVPLITFTKEDGAPIAFMFGACCHPTTMSHDNYLISAEYPGVTRRLLEKRFGSTGLFLQGIGGDVKPRRIAMETSFRSGTYEDVEAVGAELADDVTRITERGLEPFDITLRSVLGRFDVPLAPGWDETVWRGYTAGEQPFHRRQWGEWWLRRKAAGEKIPETLSMTMSIFEIAPDLRFATLSGEVLTDIGLMVKRSFPAGTTYVMGYSNGRCSYIPDSAILREGGYEAIETIFFTPTMPAPWREDIDGTILAAFQDLKREL